jgi:hypothetical protein
MKKLYALLIFLFVSSPTFALDPKSNAPITMKASASTFYTPSKDMGILVAEKEIPKDLTPNPLPIKESRQTWLQTTLTELIKLACSILLVLGSALISILAKKYKIESSQLLLNDILHRAVSYVEQVSITHLNKESNPSGAQKMSLAVEIAKVFARETELKAKEDPWWQARLEAWLGATGASKNTSPNSKAV